MTNKQFCLFGNVKKLPFIKMLPLPWIASGTSVNIPSCNIFQKIWIDVIPSYRRFSPLKSMRYLSEWITGFFSLGEELGNVDCLVGWDYINPTTTVFPKCLSIHTCACYQMFVTNWTFSLFRWSFELG
jgi:hypothetical protein